MADEHITLNDEQEPTEGEQTEGTATEEAIYTIEQYLYESVNFDVPESAVRGILKKRGVDGSEAYDPDGEPSGTVAKLLYADLLKWICLGAGRTNRVSDSDNGWSHSSGGYTLSKDDKKLLMNEANAIYDELEPESKFGQTKIRVRSAGIMPAMRDIDGEPLPRLEL